jgi:2-amino-4-hydroxy-6-hydroxymethyldihydropteridine diphosphokinase
MTAAAGAVLARSTASRAVVSLGSNIEPRGEYLARALELLGTLPDTVLEAAGNVSETEPEEVPAQYAELRFLNQIALFRTTLDVREFSRLMHAVEDELGRVRTVRNGPRTIDLDLIDFDGMRIDEPGLTLPHPRAKARAFVMRPMAELGLTLE